jgi:hypothetical protein
MYKPVHRAQTTEQVNDASARRLGVDHLGLVRVHDIEDWDRTHADRAPADHALVRRVRLNCGCDSEAGAIPATLECEGVKIAVAHLGARGRASRPESRTHWRDSALMTEAVHT